MLSALLGFSILTRVLSFNLSPEYSIIIPGPAKQDDSYFGYTVHLRSGIGQYKSSIIVGAPRANSSYAAHKKIVEPGVVYQCEIDGSVTCAPLLLDPTGEVQTAQDFIFWHQKRNALLGAAIDGQNNREGRFIACAPKWVNKYHQTQILPNNGLCYWVPDTTEVNRTAEQLIPLLIPKMQTLKEYAYGEAGFSVHMPNSDGTEVLLGAPGLFSWKGGVIWLKDQQVQDDDIISKRDIRIEYFEKSLIPDTSFMKQISVESYFGYSVNSGVFRSGDPKRKYFVASAPRDAAYKGRVFLFDLRDDHDFSGKEIQIIRVMDGTQVGEYFGASLCVTDVNGDGLDDVIVGAPRHSIRTVVKKSLRGNNFMDVGDEGAVYVFINQDSWQFQEQPKLEFAKEAGSQFGTCISSLGDLDQDGYNDIAVGAPYEDDGHGAIYIYLGTRRGLKPSFSQHIRAQSIKQNLRGFGFSITRGIDIDRNYYNDIAVGAYKSDHVVLFRSQPVARLSGTVTPSVSEIGLGAQKFQIKICLLYNGFYIPETSKLIYELQADPIYKRILFITDGRLSLRSKFVVSVNIGEEFCKVFPVQIQTFTQDFSKPIEFVMNYTLYRAIHAGFCSSCPVLDPAADNLVTAQVPYSTGCGNDSICTPDLILRHTPIGEFVIGATKSLSLELSIVNIGEPAFLTRLHLAMPDYLTLAVVPTFCNDPTTEGIICEMGNTDPSETKNITLELDTSNIDRNAAMIQVQLSATSAGEERNPSDNTVNLTIPVIRKTLFIINGKSIPEQLQYKNEKNELINNMLLQEFEIRNLGPSPISASKVEFYFPVVYDNSTMIKIMEPDTSLGKQSFKCVASYPGFNFTGSRESRELHRIRKRESSREYTLDNESFAFPTNRTQFLNCTRKGHMDPLVHCMVVTCQLGLLEVGLSRATIRFPIEAQLEEIEKIRGEKDITQIDVVAVVTPLVAVHSEKKGVAFVILGSTLIGSLPVGTISIFWIILAIILGLLILTGIVKALTKSGFFKRKSRDELQQLKQESALNLTAESTSS